MERTGNTLLIGRELLNDLRLPALTEIMRNAFQVQHFTVLTKADKKPLDVPDYLEGQQLKRIQVYPVGSSWITQRARLDRALPLTHVLHVQSHPRLCDSVSVYDSLNRPLQLSQNFPREMIAETMGDLMRALSQALHRAILVDSRLKPLTRKERLARRRAIRRSTGGSL